jgi:hypothetical protein
MKLAMRSIAKRTAVLVTVLALALVQQAQACEAWLEPLVPPIELRTLEQRVATTGTYEGHATQSEVYQVIDFEGRRIYMRTEVAGMGEMVVRYQDGRATMQMPGMPMEMPAMPELAADVEKLFDAAFAQGALPQDYELVSCDGPRSYADLVSGEQVTVRTLLPDAMGNMVEQEARLLFIDGEIVATVMEVPTLGEMAVVYEEMVKDDAGMVIRLSTRGYRLLGDTATPFSTTDLEVLAYNEPVDESLFAD